MTTPRQHNLFCGIFEDITISDHISQTILEFSNSHLAPLTKVFPLDIAKFIYNTIDNPELTPLRTSVFGQIKFFGEETSYREHLEDGLLDDPDFIAYATDYADDANTDYNHQRIITDNRHITYEEMIVRADEFNKKYWVNKCVIRKAKQMRYTRRSISQIYCWSRFIRGMHNVPTGRLRIELRKLGYDPRRFN